MRGRHTVSRLCVGCGERSPQKEMIRFTVDQKGCLKVAPRSEGRGAYLHRNPDCWVEFVKRKGLVRSLRRNVERQAREALVQKLSETAKQDERANSRKKN